MNDNNRMIVIFSLTIKTIHKLDILQPNFKMKDFLCQYCINTDDNDDDVSRNYFCIINAISGLTAYVYSTVYVN